MLVDSCGCRTSDAPSTGEQLCASQAARAHESDEIDVKKLQSVLAHESRREAFLLRCVMLMSVTTAQHRVVAPLLQALRFFCSHRASGLYR